MKKVIFVCLFFGIAITASGQQDASFSQYVFNSIHINPAYAGYKERLYIQNFYRSQWTGVKGAPKSLSIAVDGSVNHDNVGLAMLITHDQLGAQTNLSAYANYAYRLRIGRDISSRLTFGIGAGAVQSGIDGQKLDPLDRNDLFIPQEMQAAISPDVRAGVYYSNQKWFAGFSADNLLPAKIKRKDYSVLAPVPHPHYYLTAGTIFSLNQQLKLKPTFLIMDDMSGPTSLDINGFILVNERIWIGALYRTGIKLYNKQNLENDLYKPAATGLIFEVFATKNLRLGYAFDYSLNKLKTYNSGSHEISIGFSFNRRRGPEPVCYF